MVKAVIGEESQLKLAEDRLCQAALPSEVGLVIGRLSKNLDRGFVFDLIPTPQNDAGDPASSVVESVKDDSKKKGSKAKAQSDSSVLFIDKDWVAEHARQVSRMLPGGMKVVGVYIWVNESMFKNSTLILCQTVKGVSEAASQLEADSEERLLIHISYSPRRWTCRNCSLASNITASSLRPCDFKMGKALTSLQAFRCMYNFDFRLPICLDKGLSIRKLSDIVHRGLSVHAKILKRAKGLIDGRLVTKDEQSASDGLHEVEFLLPFTQDKYLEACSLKEVVGLLVFSGAVCSYAYLNPKEPISQALDDIKEDIIVSLQSRLDIMCDEADQEPESTTESNEGASHHGSSEKDIPKLDLQLQRKYCSLQFPRRVFVPWLGSTYICDYIQPSESIEVLKDHCAELMYMEAPKDASTFLEPESENAMVIASITKSFWDMVGSLSVESNPDNSFSKKSEKEEISQGAERMAARSPDSNVIVAVLVLIISIVVGLVLFIFRS